MSCRQFAVRGAIGRKLRLTNHVKYLQNAEFTGHGYRRLSHLSAELRERLRVREGLVGNDKELLNLMAKLDELSMVTRLDDTGALKNFDDICKISTCLFYDLELKQKATSLFISYGGVQILIRMLLKSNFLKPSQQHPSIGNVKSIEFIFRILFWVMDCNEGIAESLLLEYDSLPQYLYSVFLWPDQDLLWMHALDVLDIFTMETDKLIIHLENVEIINMIAYRNHDRVDVYTFCEFLGYCLGIVQTQSRGTHSSDDSKVVRNFQLNNNLKLLLQSDIFFMLTIFLDDSEDEKFDLNNDQRYTLLQNVITCVNCTSIDNPSATRLEMLCGEMREECAELLTRHDFMVPASLMIQLQAVHILCLATMCEKDFIWKVAGKLVPPLSDIFKNVCKGDNYPLKVILLHLMYCLCEYTSGPEAEGLHVRLQMLSVDEGVDMTDFSRRHTVNTMDLTEYPSSLMSQMIWMFVNTNPGDYDLHYWMARAFESFTSSHDVELHRAYTCFLIRGGLLPHLDHFLCTSPQLPQYASQQFRKLFKIMDKEYKASFAG